MRIGYKRLDSSVEALSHIDWNITARFKASEILNCPWARQAIGVGDMMNQQVANERTRRRAVVNHSITHRRSISSDLFMRSARPGPDTTRRTIVDSGIGVEDWEVPALASSPGARIITVTKRDQQLQQQQQQKHRPRHVTLPRGFD